MKPPIFQPHAPHSPHNLAYAFRQMVLAMFLFSAMTIAIRWVSFDIPSLQMVFLRNVISFFLILGWIGLLKQKEFYKTRRISRHITRGIVGFMAMEAWFYSLTILPLTFATALSFTTPIFGTLFAMWILKEKAGWRRWCGIFVGFAGVIVILNPSADEASLLGGIVLVASALMALSGILVKQLSHSETPETIVFFMVTVMTPLSAPLALLEWQPVSLENWAGIFFIALTSTAAHLLLTRAYVYADMVTLLPLDFLRLLFTAVLAYLFFAETIGVHTLIGGLIILVSTVYVAHREAVYRKQQAKIES